MKICSQNKKYTLRKQLSNNIYIFLALKQINIRILGVRDTSERSTNELIINELINK